MTASRSSSTDHGAVLVDRNGDGHLDVVASTWLQLTEPRQEQRSYVVELDGRTGETLATHRFEGWVTNIVHAGGSTVFVTEEDGARADPPARAARDQDRGARDRGDHHDPPL